MARGERKIKGSFHFALELWALIFGYSEFIQGCYGGQAWGKP